MINEVWENIEGYEGLYMISNRGRVKVLDKLIYKTVDGIVYAPIFKKGHLLKSSLNSGYSAVSLTKDKSAKQIKIHKLVAIAFIPNPNNKPSINHINAIRTDNRVENIEWCTAKENMQHAMKLGNRKTGMERKTTRILLDIQSGIYYSRVEAAFVKGLNLEQLRNKFRGKSPNNTGLIYV